MDGACWALVTEFEEWAASGGFAWTTSLVAKQNKEGITQMRTEWRPVNRRSGNAKTHDKRERQPKETQIDAEADIQELFDKWKSKKGN